jgi:hypothetical protein
MKCLRCLAISAVCLLGMPVVASAQASDVTFTVPVNLTQLSPEIYSVAVYCVVQSVAIQNGVSAGRRSVSAVNDQVHATVSVVVPIAQVDTTRSNSATYSCSLQGARRTGTREEQLKESTPTWEYFSANASVPALRLSPNPASITGTFDWVAIDATAPPPPATTTSPTGGN